MLVSILLIICSSNKLQAQSLRIEFRDYSTEISSTSLKEISFFSRLYLNKPCGQKIIYLTTPSNEANSTKLQIKRWKKVVNELKNNGVHDSNIMVQHGGIGNPNFHDLRIDRYNELTISNFPPPFRNQHFQQISLIDTLYFDPMEPKLNENQKNILDKLINQVKKDTSKEININAYHFSPCVPSKNFMNLSLNLRTTDSLIQTSIINYLLDKEIPSNQMIIRYHNYFNFAQPWVYEISINNKFYFEGTPPPFPSLKR